MEPTSTAAAGTGLAALFNPAGLLTHGALMVGSVALAAYTGVDVYGTVEGLVEPLVHAIA